MLSVGPYSFCHGFIFGHSNAIAEMAVPEYLSWRRSKSLVVGVVAFSFGKVNLSESVPTAAPIAHDGMNQVREQFHTVYDSRAGSGEVSVGVHGEDPII